MPEEPGLFDVAGNLIGWLLCQSESQNSVIKIPTSDRSLWMIKSMSCYRHKTLRSYVRIVSRLVVVRRQDQTVLTTEYSENTEGKKHPFKRGNINANEVVVMGGTRSLGAFFFLRESKPVRPFDRLRPSGRPRSTFG